MDYEQLTPEAWQVILLDTLNNPPPLPREVIRVKNSSQSLRKKATKGSEIKAAKYRHDVFTLIAQGYKQNAIAKMLNISTAYVSRIKNGWR